jgi:uncharacterized protein YdhG (YjbR/CyaY superfamily)
MTIASVDAYLSQVPEPQRSTLMQLRTTLRRLLPDADETLSYGVPAFEVDGKPVAGYAAFEKHCSYFPHSGSVLNQLEHELAGYRWSKGTLQFPTNTPLPEGLVRHLVEVRLAQLGT